MKEYLFVYGMFRDAARPMLGDKISCGRTYINGTLYKVNDFYPGYVEIGNNDVWGEVFLVDSLIFYELDEFEGKEYHRKKIKTKNDLECWIYVYVSDISSFEEVKSGDWLLR
jgi:gamma-glutamylcyclotransferase (GGCT)/AIG2-like uncharacterized protein YtfP